MMGLNTTTGRLAQNQQGFDIGTKREMNAPGALFGFHT